MKDKLEVELFSVGLVTWNNEEWDYVGKEKLLIGCSDAKSKEEVDATNKVHYSGI